MSQTAQADPPVSRAPRIQMVAGAVHGQPPDQAANQNGSGASDLPLPTQTRQRGETKEEAALKSEPDFLQKLLDRAPSRRGDIPAAEIPIYHGQDTEPVLVFHVNPLTEMEVRRDYNTATKWRPPSRDTNWQRVALETDDAMFKALVIYRATTPEDKKKYWDNRDLQSAYGVVSAWELIHHILRPGGVIQAFSHINRINGVKDEMELEQLVPNSSEPGA